MKFDKENDTLTFSGGEIEKIKSLCKHYFLKEPRLKGFLTQVHIDTTDDLIRDLYIYLDIDTSQYDYLRMEFPLHILNICGSKPENILENYDDTRNFFNKDGIKVIKNKHNQ